ncbi:MAG: hypothetical protein DMF06_13080 [Verrucomicrobia bacterium]|nr:MAG: hypothetical protein DMF06_13080 [Verrucomicrobiota bacterium]
MKYEKFEIRNTKLETMTKGLKRRKIPRRTFPFGSFSRSVIRACLKLVRDPRSLAATLAALPSMSRIPSAPFGFRISIFEFSGFWLPLHRYR